jgi:trimethylamine--corrinoid protein Co-methyltransferase
MEFALTACYEKFVIDNEILGMVMRAVSGIKVNDSTLAFDLIKEVGPGGNFVAARHTRRFMRREHYRPTLSDQNSREEWEDKGGRAIWQKAAKRVRRLMAEPQYHLPPEIREQILAEISGIID